MTAPDVSIVIPVFNRSKFIPRAIRSCLEQSVRVEVLVVETSEITHAKPKVSPPLADIRSSNNDR